jgi:Domain of unknown function (DUF397)
VTDASRQGKLTTLSDIVNSAQDELIWTKSRFSGGGGSGDCLEVAKVAGGYLLRHSVLRDKVVPLTEAEYAAFCRGVQAHQPGLVPGDL